MVAYTDNVKCCHLLMIFSYPGLVAYKKVLVTTLLFKHFVTVCFRVKQVRNILHGDSVPTSLFYFKPLKVLGKMFACLMLCPNFKWK